jgi:hypothetical protein
MYKIEITANEVKNQENKIVSLPIELKGIYQKGETEYVSIQNKEEIFDPVKDELTLQEKAQLVGNFLKEKLSLITDDLKTQSEDSDLGKLYIYVK